MKLYKLRSNKGVLNGLKIVGMGILIIVVSYFREEMSYLKNHWFSAIPYALGILGIIVGIIIIILNINSRR